jgi:molecular chaperone HtpG
MSKNAHAFTAQVSQVLKLVINSLYSNREIFLRELVSNASDALDKLRFEALKNPELIKSDHELKVQIELDAEAKVLRVRDNGIGMSADELVQNLGTIAHSGTRKFLEALEAGQRNDAQLIGQFGVGFYSGFIVADRIVVTTRSALEPNAPAQRWESDGGEGYTVEAIEDGISRGTEITLHLKEDAHEFASDWRIKSLISKYSDHLAFPVELKVTEDGKEPTFEVVNQAKALWTRPKAEIKDDEYQAFYKHSSHDFADALTWSHNRVEGTQSYTSLLFFPSQKPFDFDRARDERKGLKLFVKRVFIMDASEQLLPAYLRFVRGVIDSDDLPLNVSREILQDSPMISKIKSATVKRVLDMLDKLKADDAEKFASFYANFGSTLKEGIVEDFGNRERIAKLLSFATTAEGVASTTLGDYITRMKSGQDKIFYLTAESMTAANGSPHLEIFKRKGIEVLLMPERVDEWMMGYLHEFDGKRLKSIAKGEVDLSAFDDAAEKEAREALEKSSSKLIERLKSALGDEVNAVKVSARLTDSPACLVLGEHDMAIHMQRLFKQADHEFHAGKPTLEINPEHPLVKRIDALGDGEFGDYARLIYDQAVLAEGGQLDDPQSFVKRVNKLLLAAA